MEVKEDDEYSLTIKDGGITVWAKFDSCIEVSVVNRGERESFHLCRSSRSANFHNLVDVLVQARDRINAWEKARHDAELANEEAILSAWKKSE